MGNESRREKGNATIHSDGENATTIRNCNRNNSIMGEASVGDNNRCNNNRSNHSQHQSGRWRAAGRTSHSARQRLRKFRKGSKKFKQKINASQEQLSVLTEKEAELQSSHQALNMEGIPSADSIYAARTDEERIVKDIDSEWKKRGHGYVPKSKPDDVLMLTMENANSLSLFLPEQWKTRKLQNLNNKYEADTTLLNETGTEWNMVPDGKKLSDIFEPGKAKRVAGGFNRHDTFSRSQYGGTAAIAVSRLSGYVIESKTDSSGLGRWSWMLVGSGEHRTRIILMYQPVKPSTSAHGLVWAQYKRHFIKKGVFHNPRTMFFRQLTMLLKKWRSAGVRQHQ